MLAYRFLSRTSRTDVKITRGTVSSHDPTTMLFQSDAFSSAFIHAMEYAACGGANLTECFEASAQIRDNDRESWHRAWVTLAERVRRQGTLALSQRRKRHAHAAFLRATQYYNNAGWFMGPPASDARRATTEKASRTCFETALRLDETARPINGFEDGAAIASAYLFRAYTVNPAPRPTVLIIGDCGTSPMTLYFALASVLTRHGWHCVIVSLDDDFNDGNAVPQLLDAVARLPLVDPSCLALATFRENETAFRREARPHCCRFIFNERAIGSAHELANAAASPTFRAGLAPPAALESLTELHERLFRWLGTSR